MTFVGINEKIYFDDNLNVGIGITNPSTNFHIDSTDGIVIPVGTSAQRVDVTGAIRYNTDNSTFEGFKGTWGSLGGVIDVDQDTYISAETSAGTDNDQLKFVTAGTERMVIDSSGNTTINSDLIVDTNLLFVDASSNLVNINGDLDIWGKARFETAASYIESGVLSLSNTLTGPVIDSTGSNIRLSPSDSYVGALVVSSNGKVGIGTDSPDKALHIVSSQDEIIRLDNTSGGESYIGYYNTETVSTPSLTIGLNSTESCLINLKDEKAMIFKTYNTERMRIKSDGNVGIGTIYPNSLLEVNGDIAFTSATIKGHMIPDTDDAYDIGSAEFKIRDMYVSDDSLWVGDTHKVSITDGKMKFRKRRVSSVPAAVTAAGGSEAGAKSHSGKSSLINMKLKHWKAYMRSLPEQSTARIKDIFRDNDDDYDEQTTANNWLENGTNTYCNLGNVGIGTTEPINSLDVVGDLNITTDYNINNVQVLSSTTLGSGIVNSSLTSLGPQADQLNMNGKTINNIDRVNCTEESNVKIHLTRSDNVNNGFQIQQVDNAISLYNYEDAPIKLFTNSTQRMIIESDGNVGIGNDSPTSLLHLTKTLDVGGSGMIDMLRIEWDDAGSEDTKSGDGTKISFGTSSVNNSPASVESAYIGAIRTSGAEASHNTDLVFGTKENDSTDISEKMRIKNDGNVGIGTTDPSHKLHIYGASGDNDTEPVGILLESSNADGEPGIHFKNGTTSNNLFSIGINGSVGCLGFFYGDDNGGTQQGGNTLMTLNSSGNLGIGNTDPNALLHLGDVEDTEKLLYFHTERPWYVIQGESGSGATLDWMSTNGGKRFRIIDEGTGNIVFTAQPNTTASSQRVYLCQDGGNVGIGTDNPGYKLDVSGDISLTGNLRRTSFETGFLVGGHNIIDGSQGTSSSYYTNPIYTIGESYMPTETSLSNMYGIGYSHSNTSFLPVDCGWGMYVTAAGQLGSFLSGANNGESFVMGKFGIGTNNPQIDLAIGDGDTGFHQQGDGELAIYTNFIERVRIDNGGKVGIGTNNPQIHLAIGDSDTGFQQQGDGKLAIYTNSGERVRIDNYGNVGIGVTDPACRLEVAANPGEIRITDTNGGNSARDQGSLTFWDNDGSGGANGGHANAKITCRRVNTQAYPKGELRFDFTYQYNIQGVVWMKNDGDLENSNNRYGGISDERLKENIVDATSQWDDFKNIRFRKFNFKNRNETLLGVIAQELEQTSPGLISTREDGDIQTINGIEIENCKSVASSIMYMKGMKALQESMLRIEELESELALIKAHLGL
jgi:hypothetical protein